MADLLRPDEVVDRYRVEKKLGAGGMAEVYLVVHQTLHTRHALKVLTLSGPSLHDRLVTEGRVQARLHHPNLVHVFDVLTIKGLPALVMEYVDGPDLDQWIRLVHPEPELAAEVFRGMVAGVAVAHAAGVVHRDLKPGNVFVAQDADGKWIPKIGDFGLVKAMSSDTPGHTRAGLPMGTPQYMPPEQIRDAATVDQRADVFALGCVLYELLAHRQAYSGHDLIEIFTKVSDGDRPPLPDRVPKRLAALVDWCLATEADARPQDCAAILKGLDQGAIPSLQPVEAPPRPWLVPLGVMAGLGSVGVLAVLVLVIAAIGLRGRSLPAAPPVPDLPTCAADVAGWVRTPTIFTLQTESVWAVEASTVVVKTLPPAGRTELCVLPPGSQVRVRSRATADDATWIPVAKGLVDLHPTTDPQLGVEEVAAEPCTGRNGAPIGWFYVEPLGAGRFPPKVWQLNHARNVFADYPHRGHLPGRVVCALPANAEVRGADQQGGFGNGWWVHLLGGAIAPDP